MAECSEPEKGPGEGSSEDAALAGRDPSAGVIAFAALEFYPATAGGTGILLHHTVASLLRRGYEVLLLVDMQRHEVDRIRQETALSFVNGDRLSVHLVDDVLAADLDPLFERVEFVDAEQRRSARFARALEHLAAQRHIDLVEFYDYCGSAYYTLAQAGQNGMPPVAIRLHNTVELIAKRVRSALDPDRLLQFGMERTAIAGADLLLAPGERYFRDEIQPLYPEAGKSRMQISEPIHAPVGTLDYNPLANDVAFYGRLSTFKGVDTFIRAALLALEDPAFERWVGRFLVIGPEETVAGGLAVDALRAKIPAEWADRFVFTGRLHHERLFAQLSSAAFACFANRVESFCYAAHELATARLPLILSDTPAFRDHFAEGSEARFFDGTARDLAAEMLALAKDPAARVRLSAAGLAKRESYDREDRYAEHIAAARQIAECSGREEPLRAAILIYTDGDRGAEARTRASLPERQVLFLTSYGDDALEARDGHGSTVDLDRLPAAEAAVFLKAGDVLLPDWLERAEATLARRPRAGGVGGWEICHGAARAPQHALLPEASLAEAPGLRLLLRLSKGVTWGEALERAGAMGELPLLLAHRAAGRAVLTLTMPAVQTEGAIALRSPTLAELGARDHDRLRPDLLALMSRGTAGAEDRGEDAVIAASLADPSLLTLELLPDTGELLVLRLFEDTEGLAQPWSAAMLRGDWSDVYDAGGPVDGALRSQNGSLAVRLPRGGRIELLSSPHAGSVAVTYRGTRVVHKLTAPEIGDAAMVVEDGALRFLPPPTASTSATATMRLQAAPQAPVGTVFLVNRMEDLARWPRPEWVLPRQVVLDDLSTFDARNGDCDATAAADLANWAEKLGVERLVISSNLAPTPAFEAVLADLPSWLSVTVALIDEPSKPEGGSVEYLSAAGRWLGLVRRLRSRKGQPMVPEAPVTTPLRLATAARSDDPSSRQGTEKAVDLSVAGGAPGLLGVFDASGIDALHVPASIGMPPQSSARVSDQPDKPGSLQVAILTDRSVAAGMMHMVNAVWLASRSGLEIGGLILPESERGAFLISRDIALGLPITWHSGPGLPTLEGRRGIAISAWPEEQWPSALARAVSAGWLPLAGATSALDRYPAASALFTEPYWEDSSRLAARLAGLAEVQLEACDSLREAARAIEAEGKAAMEELMVPAMSALRVAS
ncbi:MAG: glycosyltransferase family 4 protein [Pseudomonadota bacterium]